MSNITMSSPIQIGSMRVKNRIVMAPMNTNYSDSNGCLTPQMEQYYIRRAKGGAGLIVLEAVSVAPDTRNHGVQPMLWDEKYVPQWSNLIEQLQSYGAAVSVEIAHFGSEATLAPRVSSSEVSRFPGVEVESLSRERIRQVQNAYVTTALNAKMAGVDAVTLHGAHGYLIAEFMSPLYNKRTDEYGGSLENRLRFVTEIVAMLREKLGPRFPVIVRYSVDEFVTGGRDASQSAEIAKILEKSGVSAIDLSAGVPNTYIFTNPPNGLGDTACMLIEKAAEVKKAVSVPVICANSIRYPAEIDKMLSEGKVDMAAIARPLLADADFPKKALEGRAAEIRPCLSCQHCFRTLDSGRSLRCAVNPETGREYVYGEISPQIPKRLLVVGGGPAGMEASRVAALEGHEVTLCEKSDKLGGSLIAAAVPPHKGKIAELIKWYEGQMELLGVKLLMCTEAADALIEEINPEKIINACGADYARFIEGSDGAGVMTALEALLSPEKVGENVVIIGGGATGCETAEYFSGDGLEFKWLGKTGVDGPLRYEKLSRAATISPRNITIVEMLPELASDMDDFNRELMRIVLKEKGVTGLTGAKVLEIAPGKVQVSLPDGSDESIAADTVILCAGLSPKRCEAALDADRAGDSIKPGRIADATFTAYSLARRIFTED